MSCLNEDRDRFSFEKIMNDPEHVLYELLPPKRLRVLRQRDRAFILPKVRTERYKRSFLNRCLFNFFYWNNLMGINNVNRF